MFTAKDTKSSLEQLEIKSNQADALAVDISEIVFEKYARHFELKQENSEEFVGMRVLKDLIGNIELVPLLYATLAFHEKDRIKRFRYRHFSNNTSQKDKSIVFSQLHSCIDTFSAKLIEFKSNTNIMIKKLFFIDL